MYKSKGMKNVSIQMVKDYFINNKVGIKSDIARATGLSQATITNILKELGKVKYIKRIEDCDSTGGRKAKRYQICGQYMYFGLLQLQVMNKEIYIGFTIVDLNGEDIYVHNYRMKQITVNTLITMIENMKKTCALEYVGISVPGIVKDGFVSKCDIPTLENRNLKTYLEHSLRIRIQIENDVNTAMLGYIHHHCDVDSSVAFVYQPDNHHSGCSLYINKKIVYGATHLAGELGYLPNGTLEEQMEIVKTDPLTLLIKQIVSIIAITNPSHMILYTPCSKLKDILEVLPSYIPKEHLPILIGIDSMEKYVYKGLFNLCLESSRFSIK